MKKNIFLFLLIAVLSAPGFSNAEITFQPEQSSASGWGLDNLPQPLSEFIKSAEDIGGTVNAQFGKYVSIWSFKSPVDVDLNQLNDVNLTQWFRDIFQNDSSNSLYLLAVKIFSAVGNLFVWILNIVIDLIKQILSLVY